MDSYKFNICNKVFGTNVSNFMYLIKNVSNICTNYIDNNTISYNHRIYFQLLGKDESIYNNIDTTELTEINYNDNVLVSYKEIIKGVNVKLNVTNKTINRSTRISSMVSKDTDIEIPILCSFTINNEFIVDDEYINDIYNNNNIKNGNIDYFQRKQEISYVSSKKYLQNWKINKTVIFKTYDCKHNKLLHKLEKSNVITPKYYDYLVVSFDYIGLFEEFEESVFALFEYIYKNDFTTFNINYNIINNNIMKLYNKTLMEIINKVGIVTCDFIVNENTDNYVFEEKFDGERCLLIVHDNNIYEYNKNNITIIKTLKGDNNIFTIVDAEKVDKKYIIFDCILFDNIDINNETYLKRLSKVRKFVNRYHKIINCNSVVCYKIGNNNIESWNKLLNINNRYSIIDNVKVKTDGLILRNVNTSFINGKVYKLKNPIMTTIDFMLKYDSSGKQYYLYMIGNVNHLLTKAPLLNYNQYKHFGYSLNEKTQNVYMLFDNPFINNICKFKPINNWYIENYKYNKYIDEDFINNTNNIINDMINNPYKYDGKIVELSLYNKKWIPVKIRNDKTASNGYPLGISIIELLFCKLSTKYVNMKQLCNNDINIDSYYNIFNKYITSNDVIVCNIDSFDLQITTVFNKLHINELYLLSNNKYSLVKACDNIRYKNKYEIDLHCIYNKNNDYNNMYSKLLKTNFEISSCTLYIDRNINNIGFINNIMSANGKIMIINDNDKNNISRERITHEMIDELYVSIYK